MFVLFAAAALARTPDLATQLKRAHRARAEPPRHGIAIRSFHLDPEVARLSGESLALRLQKPMDVGTVHTRAHGTLQVTCHLDACSVKLGSIEVGLSLVGA